VIAEAWALYAVVLGSTRLPESISCTGVDLPVDSLDLLLLLLRQAAIGQQKKTRKAAMTRTAMTPTTMPAIAPPDNLEEPELPVGFVVLVPVPEPELEPEPEAVPFDDVGCEAGMART